MRIKENIAVVLVAGIFAFLGIYFWWNSDDGIVWSPSLVQDKYQPYDLGYLKKILDKSSDKEFKVIERDLEKSLKNKKNTNYLLLGETSYFNKKEFKALKEYIKRGNNAFIAVNQLEPDLEEFLYFIYIESQNECDKFDVRLESEGDKQFPFIFHGPYGKIPYNLNYFQMYSETEEEEYEEEYNDEYEEEYEEDEYAEDMEDLYVEEDLEEPEEEEEEFVAEYEEYSELGSFRSFAEKGKLENPEYLNYIEIPLGKGKMYVHCNPILFTNYQLKSKAGFEYANAVFGPMGNKDIIWDEYSTMYKYEGGEENNNQEMPSALEFVLKHRGLKYAWYTLLVSILVFVVFRSKRRQKIIPILPLVENTSLEFSRSLGALYIQNGSGKPLAMELMTLFDNYNRRKYRINRDKKDLTSAKIIADKARVDHKLVERILNLERQIIYNPTSSVKDVMPLHEAIKEYYNKSKR